MRVTFISFYTVGTPYEQEIKGLYDSLNKFSLPHDIRFVKPFGSWEKNANYKAHFIRSMMDIRASYGDEAIVWLDADSVIKRKPDLFGMIDTDIALYFKTTGHGAEKMGSVELITASMFFRINDRVRALMDMWISQIESPQWDMLIEQRSLQVVLPEWRRSLGGTVAWLPQSYCRIFDAPEDHHVIVQNQASRRFRSAVGSAGQ